jgi:hypothetical protein
MAFRVSFVCLPALYRQEVVTMAKAVVVRYETRPDAGDRNQHLIEQVFAELNAEDPTAPQAARAAAGAAALVAQWHVVSLAMRSTGPGSLRGREEVIAQILVIRRAGTAPDGTGPRRRVQGNAAGPGFARG